MPFSLTWEGNYVSSDRRTPTDHGRGLSGSSIIYNSSGIPTGDMSASRLPTHSLSPDQVKYMQRVTRAAKAQGICPPFTVCEGKFADPHVFFIEYKLRQLHELKMYEEPMFWCSQLFLPGWTPPSTPSPQESYTVNEMGTTITVQ